MLTTWLNGTGFAVHKCFQEGHWDILGSTERSSENFLLQVVNTCLEGKEAIFCSDSIQTLHIFRCLFRCVNITSDI